MLIHFNIKRYLVPINLKHKKTAARAVLFNAEA